MIIATCLLIISGIAKAHMDVSSEGGLAKGLNKSESWRNKWNNGDPAQGEKFLGSSTAFVFLTDFWHAMQFVFLNSLIIGVVLLCEDANLVWSIVVASVLPRMVFETTYRILKRG